MTRRAARKSETRKLQLVTANHEAITQGPRRKSFSVQDMHHIEPLTDNQERAFDAWDDTRNDLVGMLGYAGTGKTFIALYLALQSVLDKDTPYDRVIIVRSAVQSREIGFLPGDLTERLAPYENPYRAICDRLFKFKNSYDNMKEAGKIQFECSSFLRGNTFDDCIVIFDEVQCTTSVEFETALTRVGDRCRMLICGDDLQNDIGNQSGFSSVVPILKKTDGAEFINFGLADIVRSGFVRAYLMAKYEKKK